MEKCLLEADISLAANERPLFVSLLAVQLGVARRFHQINLLWKPNYLIDKIVIFLLLWTSMFQLPSGYDSTALKNKTHIMSKAGQPRTTNDTAIVFSSLFLMLMCGLFCSDSPVVQSNHVEGCVDYAKFNDCGPATPTIPCGFARRSRPGTEREAHSSDPEYMKRHNDTTGNRFLSRSAYSSVQALFSFGRHHVGECVVYPKFEPPRATHFFCGVGR